MKKKEVILHPFHGEIVEFIEGRYKYPRCGYAFIDGIYTGSDKSSLLCGWNWVTQIIRTFPNNPNDKVLRDKQ